MKKSQFTETQIVSILNEADAGVKVQDLCRKHGISPATYYKWKSKYGGLSVSELKRIKELEAGSAKLKLYRVHNHPTVASAWEAVLAAFSGLNRPDFAGDSIL